MLFPEEIAAAVAGSKREGEGERATEREEPRGEHGTSMRDGTSMRG